MGLYPKILLTFSLINIKMKNKFDFYVFWYRKGKASPVFSTTHFSPFYKKIDLIYGWISNSRKSLSALPYKKLYH